MALGNGAERIIKSGKTAYRHVHSDYHLQWLHCQDQSLATGWKMSCRFAEI